jgi:hypothetical protein
MSAPVADAPAVVARSGSAASGAPVAPDRAGRPYRFEMLFAGGTRRAYADTAAPLVDVLAPGYLLASDTDRWQSRLLLAAQAQAEVQAYLNERTGLAQTTVGQHAVLTGPRHVPPAVGTDWDCDVPLVLVDAHYAPVGPLPAPTGNVEWIRAADDLALLVSLHQVWFVSRHERGYDLTPGAGEED